MERPPTTYTPDRLAELLDAWRRPGGVLAPDELRALLAWSGTTAEDRESLQEALAVTQQQVEAKPLAPQQRRGHVSWLDRIRSLFRR